MMSNHDVNQRLFSSQSQSTSPYLSNCLSTSSYGANNDQSKQTDESSRQRQHSTYQDNNPEKMDQDNSSVELQHFKKKSKTVHSQAEATMSGSSSTLGPTLATGIDNGPSQQARRYAETRFPFPPFIVKFTQDVKEQDILNELDDHFYKSS
ncbi:unnamed protein product [Didymodactylos carnosus]|uniref:Uncharacterized protein n=1 Tax=Didymodactylos carnosus TaxID=1234261 RepID=A0A816DK22_9BILA|nr:unnamed protein product [Didymodactylos carnosus]CAF4545070.1 unnamed protein product [Didymodactylos carnosus]